MTKVKYKPNRIYTSVGYTHRLLRIGSYVVQAPVIGVHYMPFTHSVERWLA